MSLLRPIWEGLLSGWALIWARCQRVPADSVFPAAVHGCVAGMTPPQSVAEPADEPQAALIATCTCGRRIWRLALDSAR